MPQPEEWERLLEQLRAEFLLREEELELLHAIDLQLMEDSPQLGRTFAFIVDQTRALLGADHSHILLRRGRFLETAHSGSPADLGQLLPIEGTITGGCFATETTVNLGDLKEPGLAARYIPIAGYHGPPMQSLLAAPIRVHGEVIGVLNSESVRPAAFRQVHERCAEAIAAQVAIAVQRGQVFDQSALFAEVDDLIFADSDSHRVIQVALRRVMDQLRDLEHVQLSGAQILFRRGQDELEVVHSTDPSNVGLVLSLHGSICGRAVRTGRTVVVKDVDADLDYRRLLGPQIRSEIAVPIRVGGDQAVVIGALNVESEEPDAFSGFYQIILDSFADRVRTLLAFAKLRSDVTDALELRQANDLLVAVGDQTSNMIHRINNTVGAMRFRLLEMQRRSRDGSLGDGDYLDESLRALLRSVEKTLDMPRQVTQFLSQETDLVDVNAAVRSALASTAPSPAVKVVLDLEDGLPRLPLYCFDLVIENLLRNAIDAMSDGGALTVRTSSILSPGPVNGHPATGYVEIAVADTGTGVPPDLLSQIFEINFTTKAEKGKGLGLGLWWVRNFVRRARGEITVTSQPDVGTEFTVRIPFDRFDRHDRPRAGATPSGESA